MASDVLTNWETEALFDALRDLRLKISEEQSVPPYAILPDRTLLEMVRYRPEDMETMACMSGMGEVKLGRFGKIFLNSLDLHAEKYGRPPNLPPIPMERAERREKQKQKKKEFSGTAQESLDLFRELGDVDAVAQRRGLKPASIWKHLGQAAQFGKIDYHKVVNLPDEDIELIRTTCLAFKQKGILAMSPVFEALEGKYPYEILRLIRACAK